MEAPVVLRLLAVVVLVAANAYFVAAEFVLVSVRSTRLRQLEKEGHAAARVALRLHNQIDRVLPATQLGVTLASLGLGWIGENVISQLLMPAFAALSRGPRLALAHSAAIAAAFLIITALHMVLGEVVPKNVALGPSGERLALMLARPMDAFIRATHPLLRVLNAAAASVSRLFGARAAAPHHFHSAEEIQMLVKAGVESGVLQEELEGMIHGIFDLHKIQVREVMVPRPDIAAVRADAPLEEILRAVLNYGHSRLLVYEGSPDHFIGLLFVKDLFRVWLENHSAGGGAAARRFRLRPLLHKLPIVPETKPLDGLLQEFRQRRVYLALVVDEFGSIAGLVTLVDVVERIMGEFAEESEAAAPRAAADAALLVEGSTHTHEMEERYGIQLPRHSGFETLAGFLMHRFGHIPAAGESLVFGGWRFTVTETDHHRIELVRLDRVKPEAEGKNPDRS
jgi:putative hemolysin